jgi:ABC-type nitrate/sulfonate/bicarbonate transport system permease component
VFTGAGPSARSAARRARALAAFLLLWHVLSASGLVPAQIVPPPFTVFRTFAELALDWSDFARENLQFQLVIATGLSLARVAAGLAIGIAVGVAAGGLVGWFPVAAFPIDLLIRTLRPIPGLAWVPLAIAWFGVGFLGPIFIVSMSAVFPIAIATIHGVRTANPVYVASLRTLGARDWHVVREAILPGAVPSILTGVRVGMNLGWWSVIAAELFGARGGLGFLIRFHGDVVKMPEAMAGMLAVGLVGFVLDRGYAAVHGRLVAWQGPRGSLTARRT